MTNKTTSSIDLVEELSIAARDLRAQRRFLKDGVESTTGFSFDALAHLYEKSADTITRLQAALTDAEDAMSAAMVMIGARNDTLTEAQRQGNVNQAWHRLKSGREALRSSVGGE